MKPKFRLYLSFILLLLLTTFIFSDDLDDGNVCFIKGDYSKALEQYQNNNYNSDLNILNIANAYYALKDYDKAIEYYHKAIIMLGGDKEQYVISNNEKTNNLLSSAFYNVGLTYYKLYLTERNSEGDNSLNLFKAFENNKKSIIYDNSLYDAKINYCFFYKLIKDLPKPKKNDQKREEKNLKPDNNQKKNELKKWEEYDKILNQLDQKEKYIKQNNKLQNQKKTNQIDENKDW